MERLVKVGHGARLQEQPETHACGVSKAMHGVAQRARHTCGSLSDLLPMHCECALSVHRCATQPLPAPSMQLCSLGTIQQ